VPELQQVLLQQNWLQQQQHESSFHSTCRTHITSGSGCRSNSTGLGIRGSSSSSGSSSGCSNRGRSHGSSRVQQQMQGLGPLEGPPLLLGQQPVQMVSACLQQQWLAVKQGHPTPACFGRWLPVHRQLSLLHMLGHGFNLLMVHSSSGNCCSLGRWAPRTQCTTRACSCTA